MTKSKSEIFRLLAEPGVAAFLTDGDIEEIDGILRHRKTVVHQQHFGTLMVGDRVRVSPDLDRGVAGRGPSVLRTIVGFWWKKWDGVNAALNPPHPRVLVSPGVFEDQPVVQLGPNQVMLQDIRPDQIAKRARVPTLSRCPDYACGGYADLHRDGWAPSTFNELSGPMRCAWPDTWECPTCKRIWWWHEEQT